MKFLDYLTGAIIIIIAITFTALSSLMLPKHIFKPNRLKLDSTWHKKTDEQAYVLNILNNSNPEMLVHHNINKSGNSIEYRYNNRLHQIYIFKKNEYLISKFLYFSSIDQDDIMEVVFITAQENKAYLNILRYDSSINLLNRLPKVEIDSISYYNGKPDVVNNSITSYQNEIYFDLTAGYSIQPRKIYKYDFSTEKLTKTGLNSFSIKKIAHEIINGQGLILAEEIVATSNTAAHSDLEMLMNSKDPDTLKIYEEIKHLEYAYGDFSSYILLYTDSMNFAFEPIEFFGWTNYTKSEFINIGGIPHIIALTNTIKGDSNSKRITVCNMQGTIKQQISIPHNYTDIFTDSKSIVFKDENALYQYSYKLDILNEISGITHCEGFIDMNKDLENELMAFRDNEMIVFSPDLNILATFKINQEFAPYPDENGIQLFHKGDKPSFVFNTRLFYYLFTFTHNPIAAFKYPFYIITFLFWVGLMLLILNLNSRRLQKEKQQLEKIVSERTLELVSKNKELANKNKEIQNSQEELKTAVKLLAETNATKDKFYSIIAHDLKSPFNSMLGFSKLLHNDFEDYNKDEQKKFIGYIHQKIQDIYNLLETLLQWEQSQSGGITFNPTKIDLYAITKASFSLLNQSAQDKAIELMNLIPENTYIHADGNMISTIIRNLVSNAIKFTNKGGEVRVETSLEKDDTFIEIVVKDNGIGISEDTKSKLFMISENISTKGTEQETGSGLGLLLCMEFAEKHKGEIWATSELGKGSSFHVKIPYQDLK
jgi:signal transduction histidine kinase